VFGARHGIEGVLKEELLNLSAQAPDEVALLRYTPAAGSIGTCRYKLKPNQTEDFERVIEVLKAHQVGYFLHGGNDSMDTAHKIAKIAHEKGLNLVGIGGPKTIDNDVGDSEFKLIDHTPGYGSVAKFWMHTVQTANEENEGSSPADPVLVMQAMGRKIGYLPAAARLAIPSARCRCKSIWPKALARSAMVTRSTTTPMSGRCIVVISEGFNVATWATCGFVRPHVSSQQMTVAQIVVNYLKSRPAPRAAGARAWH
jgi:6-phosphofructokinase 1